MVVFRPDDAAQAREVVADAADAGHALEIVAGGSKRGFGRPAHVDNVIDVARLSHIVDYDAAELVLTAQAAATLADIEAQLSAHQQMLAFEPPDFGGLFGGHGESTLGGTIACNLAGPRRVRAGAARDHLLGLSAIDGRGETWKAGGRVVKNVTGYDMCKLQAGAHGTLSVLTELSVRVIPKPETSCTVVLHGLSDAEAVAAMSRALNTPHEVSAAAHLPDAIATRSIVVAGPATVLRIEGHAPSVTYRANALATLFGGATRLDPASTARLWAEIGNVSTLIPPAGRCVWRVCPTPSSAPSLLRAVRAVLDAEAFYDWGGALVWISLDAIEAGPDAGAALLRACVRDAGGHATLMVAPDPTRARVPVFEPEPEALAALSARVKHGFDPRRILNPGRMREGL